MFKWLAWAWKDLRDDWNRLEGAKVMGGLLMVPVFFGVAYELINAAGIYATAAAFTLICAVTAMFARDER